MTSSIPRHQCLSAAALALLALSVGALTPSQTLAEAPPTSGGAAAEVAEKTLGRIRDAALNSDWAWDHLSELTDSIGPRLSGSPGLEAAVEALSAAARAQGAQVSLQDVSVPHWVRGREEAQLVDFPGHRAGVNQTLHLTALGGSAATVPEGLTAQALVVGDVDELRARGREVPGKVVVLVSRFDQHLADNGYGLDSYELAGRSRFDGPALAQSLGAVAVLVRSIGGADYRLPHTGGVSWGPQQPRLPAAALAAEDADLIARLGRKGPVTVRLVLTPQTLPEAPSHNVLADWPGRELPNEIVIVSGHLDSWDLGTGAIDDGGGVIASAAVIEVLNRLHLHARRTIRFIAWTNEENGSRGSSVYLRTMATSLPEHFAAIESDLGSGTALGLTAAVTPQTLPELRPVLRALQPLGATVLSRTDGEAGSDIGGLQEAGVPGFAPLLDTRHYFDYHHTAADTLDKISPADLRAQVATLAVLAYYLADMPGPLPRFKIAP